VNIRKNLILPESPCWRFAPLTVCVYLKSSLVFTQLFFESRTVGARKKTARKQNLTRNSHSSISRSFNVTHFRITEKPTTDCVSLYNNAGLVSKVSEERASENAENCRYVQPNCRLTPHPEGISANIRIKLISPETSHWRTFIFAIDSIGLLSFNFCGGLRKTHLFCNRVRIGRSRSSKVVDFGTNRKDVCDFLLVINSE